MPTTTTGAEAVVRSLEQARGVLFRRSGRRIMPVCDALYGSEITHVTMATK
jgi:thiamine pyrophosphate-dependent acetolactate synthase large subunit-like protein